MSFKKHAPLWAASAAWMALLLTLLTLTLRANDGKLIYALDDAYIHMAMAKNFAQHGVWGVTAAGFTSSSSSPGWTLLLALFGAQDGLPLALNALAGWGLLALVYAYFRQHSARRIFALLLALLLLTPLPFLAFTGMEHTLHTLVIAALCLSVLGERSLWWSALLAAAALALRYESAFVIAPLCALLAWRGRGKQALALGGAALLPVALYALVSLSQGWYAVPNALLIKSAGALYVEGDALNYWLYRVFVNLGQQPHLLLLALAALFLLRVASARPLLLVFLAALLLHVRLAGAGVHFRYEAYLVALGLIALYAAAVQARIETRRPLIMALLALALLYGALPLARRAWESLLAVVPATQNIYLQQVQMGLFLRQYYTGAAVAANDIGAIAYLAQIDLIDVIGLANMEIARARENGTYTPERIAEIAAPAEIAIVYDSWLRQGVPPGWRAVGAWRVDMPVIVLGDATITFYAVSPLAEARLAAFLADFSPRLPEHVAESGAYTALLPLARALAVLPPPFALRAGDTTQGVAASVDALIDFVPENAAQTLLVVGETPDALPGFALYSRAALSAETLAIFLRTPPQTPLDVAFGADIRLRALDVRGAQVSGDGTYLLAACERLIVTSWWQTAHAPDSAYSLTVNLFGAGLLFSDQPPPLATPTWQAGTLYADVRTLDVGCAAGDYTLALGLHDAAGTFLAVNGADFYAAAQIRVTAP
ncbi:MAG: hypothetical protein HXY40_02920 [Chloroflexi bacterium]|nr:hypothetical protein [Chloroflexota bacterium]